MGVIVGEKGEGNPKLYDCGYTATFNIVRTVPRSIILKCPAGILWNPNRKTSKNRLTKTNSQKTDAFRARWIWALAETKVDTSDPPKDSVAPPSKRELELEAGFHLDSHLYDIQVCTGAVLLIISKTPRCHLPQSV